MKSGPQPLKMSLPTIVKKWSCYFSLQNDSSFPSSPLFARVAIHASMCAMFLWVAPEEIDNVRETAVFVVVVVVDFR